MTRKLLVFVLLARPIRLTDWLEAPVELKAWVFEKFGWHRGVEVCAGWCPCGVDFDLGELDLDVAEAA